MSDRTEQDREWQHAACLSIAEGCAGWDTELGERASPAMLAVQTLRREWETAKQAFEMMASFACEWSVRDLPSCDVAPERGGCCNACWAQRAANEWLGRIVAAKEHADG